MKIKCGNCEIEDQGQYKKLVERGWKIFFLQEKVKIIRCKKCKPNAKDKLKKIFNKDYKPEMSYEIGDALTKFKILKGLKTREELREARLKREMKKRKHYTYQRAKKNHIEKGSKSAGYSTPSGIDQ